MVCGRQLALGTVCTTPWLREVQCSSSPPACHTQCQIVASLAHDLAAAAAADIDLCTRGVACGCAISLCTCAFLFAACWGCRRAAGQKAQALTSGRCRAVAGGRSSSRRRRWVCLQCCLQCEACSVQPAAKFPGQVLPAPMLSSWRSCLSQPIACSTNHTCSCLISTVT